MLTLRENQKEPVRKAIEYFREDNPEPALMVMPTAFGKSILAAEVAAACPDPILVVQPTKELLEQNLAKYRLLCGELAPAGIYSASFGKKQIDHVTFATIGSIKKIGASFRDLGFKKMLIDEAHLYPRSEQSMLGQFLKDSGITQVLGITATPLKLENFGEKQGERFDKWSTLTMLTSLSPYGTFFKKILHVSQVSEMTRLGYWSPLKYEVLPFDRSALALNSTGSEFTDDSVITSYVANNIRANIFAALNYHRDRRHCLVFVPSVEEAQVLASEYPQSAFMCADTPKKERARIISDFREGKIRVLFNVTILTCLSMETEILTIDGWKKYNEISLEDKVAQYDNGEITFSCPNAIFTKKHTGKMVTADGKYMKLRVTDDHNLLFTKKTTNGKYKTLTKTEAKNLVNKRFIYIPIHGQAKPFNIQPEQEKRVSDNRFITQNSYNYRKKGMTSEEAHHLAVELLKRRNQRKYKNPNELTINECAFIGFWLGDGSKSKNSSGGTRYTICQSTANPEMIVWIDRILKDTNIHYSKRIIQPKKEVLGKQCNVHPAIEYLLSIGTGGHKQNKNSNLYSLLPYLIKDGTELFWGLNQEQFEALIYGYAMANGSHGNNILKRLDQIVCANKKLIDLFQAIATCRGLRMKVNKLNPNQHTKTTLYRFSVSKVKYHQFVNDKLTLTENTEEQVWCVNMPQGTIVTRYKGNVSIMGNCGFDYTKIDLVILASSTASVSRYFQEVGRGVRIDPEKKDCIIVDMAGNVERFGKAEDALYKLGADGRWRLYGSGGRLLTGLPIPLVGTVSRTDICRALSGPWTDPVLNFGKHKGRRMSEIPFSYRTWMYENMSDRLSEDEKDCILRFIENYVRDTRRDPPMGIMPEGQHSGKPLSEIPAGYLSWYYNTKNWNETNDSLRRGLEIRLGKQQY